MTITTKEFENRIEKAKTPEDLRQVLSDLPQTTFPLRIDALCKAHAMSFSQVQVASGITKSLFYNLVNGTRKPKKAHIIKIGLAMRLSLGEINELLKLAGLKELYAKNKEDAVVIFGLQNKLTETQIENLLLDVESTLHLIEK